MIRVLAGAALGVARVKGAKVQLIDGLADEVGQVPLGQPVLQRAGQQLLLPRLVGYVACAHVTSIPLPSYFIYNPLVLLPPRLLGIPTVHGWG